MLFSEEVVAAIIERARILNESAISLAAREPGARRHAFDGVVAALVVKVGVCGDGERQLLGPDLEPVHVGKNHLLRRLSNAGVDHYHVVAHKEVLEEVATAVKGLNLVDALVEFHHSSAPNKIGVSLDLYTSLAAGSILAGSCGEDKRRQATSEASEDKLDRLE